MKMPKWLEEEEEKSQGRAWKKAAERVRLVVGWAVENARRGTGGPFAAAVFDAKSRELVAAGVNVVVPSGQSWRHAEMVAIARAQEKLGRLDLAGYELVSSCEPCVMCFGGTLWSGVTELTYGADGALARAAGFDEGDKVDDWKESLEKRGIRVRGPGCETELEEPFREYAAQGGKIY